MSTPTISRPIRLAADVVEDAEFMARTGETWPRAAERLGYTTRSLERILHRAGRYDLVTHLKKNTHR